MLITPPPSSHPNAEKIRSRIRRRVVQASASPLVHARIELLNNHRGLGWVSGEERIQLVRDIHAEMDDLKFNVTLDELLAAYGAGPWEPK